MMICLGFLGVILAAGLLYLLLGESDILRNLGVGDRQQSERPDQALEILKQRYAEGEIDTEEYEARRRALDNEDKRP